MTVKDKDKFEEIIDDPKTDDVDLWMTGDDDPKPDDDDDPKPDDDNDPKPDDDDDPKPDDDDDPKPDDDDNPKPDDDDDPKSDDDDKLVSVKKHIKMKQKLKKRASDKEEENKRLKEKIDALEAQIQATAPVTKEKLVRPNADDFETDEEYQAAVKEYEEKLVDARMDARDERKAARVKREAYIAKRDAAVDEHYDRAAKLIKDSNIDLEIYKNAEDKVRNSIAKVLPKPEMADAMIDHLISMMGDGSEKVLYFIGRNSKVLGGLIDAVESDLTGITASMYLGRQLEKVAGTKNRVSRARKPAKDAKGDSKTNQAGASWRRKYEAAHKSGDNQKAFDLKREARKSGIDTGAWD